MAIFDRKQPFFIELTFSSICLSLFILIKKLISENFTETNLSGKWSRDIHRVELIPFLNNSILSDKKSDRKITEKFNGFSNNET